MTDLVQVQPITRVLCECRCGLPVTFTRSGHPNTYLRGHHNRGIPKSESQRLKQSLAMAGKPGPWLGKTIPERARQNMRDAKIGGTLSATHRAKISASGKGRIASPATIAKMKAHKHTPRNQKKDEPRPARIARFGLEGWR